MREKGKREERHIISLYLQMERDEKPKGEKRKTPSPLAGSVPEKEKIQRLLTAASEEIQESAKGKKKRRSITPTFLEKKKEKESTAARGLIFGMGRGEAREQRRRGKKKRRSFDRTNASLGGVCLASHLKRQGWQRKKRRNDADYKKKARERKSNFPRSGPRKTSAPEFY